MKSLPLNISSVCLSVYLPVCLSDFRIELCCYRGWPWIHGAAQVVLELVIILMFLWSYSEDGQTQKV